MSNNLPSTRVVTFYFISVYYFPNETFLRTVKFLSCLIDEWQHNSSNATNLHLFYRLILNMEDKLDISIQTSGQNQN